MPKPSKAFTKWKKSEVTDFFKTARVVYKSPYITILRNSTKQAFGKILITTSKKIGNAVVRNKLRRQLKAIIHAHTFYSIPQNYALITKPPVTTLSYQDLEKILFKAWNRK